MPVSETRRGSHTQTSRPWTRAALGLLGLAAAAASSVGCASVRPIQEVIDVAARSEGAAGAGPSARGSIGPAAPDAPPARTDLVAYAMRKIDEYDAGCRACLNAAEAEDAGYDALMAASRALIFNADLRIQLDAVQRLDPSAPGEVESVIFAEDAASSELRAEIRSLAKTSRDFAARALELRDNDGPARLFRALGDGLYLWSLGPMQALTSGAIRTLPGRVKRLAADDPSLEGASPLRLEGRFATRAPWPYRDRAAAIGILERACASAPLPINLVFLGDARWLTGDPSGARAAWERAAKADADELTGAAAPLFRELARLRLVAASAATAE